MSTNTAQELGHIEMVNRILRQMLDTLELGIYGCFVFSILNIPLVNYFYLLSLVPLVAFSCGGKAKPAPVRSGTSNIAIGTCAEPESSGVLSDSPKLARAPRDLNGDGTPETVVGDKHLCRQGNCFWNLFASQDGCSRYLGTIEGRSLEVLSVSSSNGFRELRAWWSLPGGTRQLSQRYQYRERGYQLIEVLLCRDTDDKGVQCASEEKGKE